MNRALMAILLMVVWPAQVQAQFVPPRPETLRATALLLAEVPAPERPTVRMASGRTRGAVIGFVVGSAIGVAAGYGAFNALCEAVDNRCEGSRALWMAVGGLAFGGLGALVGVVAD